MPDANTLIWLVIALLNAWVGWMTYRVHKEVAATKLAVVATMVAAEKTELNTNSMREQLVVATGAAAHAAGRDEMAKEAKAIAATLAEGVKQGEDRQDAPAAPAQKGVVERSTAAAETVASETKRLADETKRIADKEG